MPEPKVGETIADRYELIDELGRGGMGVVFSARHLISGRRVALKWMKPDPDDPGAAKGRFLREARAMGRIEHRSVVGVHDVGEASDGAFLVMDLLRGKSLRDMLDASGPMSVEAAVALLLSAMEGVEAAHRAGVVHRDLKPENLFVTTAADGSSITKVLDFGISKVRKDQPDSGPTITRTGQMMGTPQYMAPEQVRGAMIDERADVWALGAILFEMLAGVPPFRADNYGGLLVAIATEEPLSLVEHAPDLPRGITAIVDRALDKEPARRFPTVMALALALQPFGDGARFVEPRRPSAAPPPDDHAPRPAPSAHAETGELADSPRVELVADAPGPIPDDAKVTRPLGGELGSPAAGPSMAERDEEDEHAPASSPALTTRSLARLAGVRPSARWTVGLALVAVALVAAGSIALGVGDSSASDVERPPIAASTPAPAREPAPAEAPVVGAAPGDALTLAEGDRTPASAATGAPSDERVGAVEGGLGDPERDAETEPVPATPPAREAASSDVRPSRAHRGHRERAEPGHGVVGRSGSLTRDDF